MDHFDEAVLKGNRLLSSLNFWVCITEGSSITVSPNVSGVPSGLSILRNASGSPTAGIKSGINGLSFVSISRIVGRYLIKAIPSSLHYLSVLKSLTL